MQHCFGSPSKQCQHYLQRLPQKTRRYFEISSRKRDNNATLGIKSTRICNGVAGQLDSAALDEELLLLGAAADAVVAAVASTSASDAPAEAEEEEEEEKKRTLDLADLRPIRLNKKLR